MLKRKRKKIKIPTLIIAKMKRLILKKMVLKNQMIIIMKSQVMLMIMAILIIIKANHLTILITVQINKTTQAQNSIHLILMHQTLMHLKRMIYQKRQMSMYLSQVK